jgi:hypothetical protein
MKKILLLLITLLSGTVCQGVETLYVDTTKTPANPIAIPIPDETPIWFITSGVNPLKFSLPHKDAVKLVGGMLWSVPCHDNDKTTLVAVSLHINQGIKNYVKGINPAPAKSTRPAPQHTNVHYANTPPNLQPTTKSTPPVRPVTRSNAKKPKSTPQVLPVARWNSKWFGAASAVAVIGLLGWYYRAYLARG